MSEIKIKIVNNGYILEYEKGGKTVFSVSTLSWQYLCKNLREALDDVNEVGEPKIKKQALK